MVGPFDHCVVDDRLISAAVFVEPAPPLMTGARRLLLAILDQARRDAVSRRRGLAPAAVSWLEDDRVVEGETGWSFGAVAMHLGLAPSPVARRVEQAARMRSRLRLVSESRGASRIVEPAEREAASARRTSSARVAHRSSISR